MQKSETPVRNTSRQKLQHFVSSNFEVLYLYIDRLYSTLITYDAA